MATRVNAVKECLLRNREIHITVAGRKTGREISIPVWFVLDGEKLYLLPVQGSETQWYKNVVNNPLIRIDAGRREGRIHCCSGHRSRASVSDCLEVPRKVWRERREEVLLEVRRWHSRSASLTMRPCGCVLSWPAI